MCLLDTLCQAWLWDSDTEFFKSGSGYISTYFEFYPPTRAWMKPLLVVASCSAKREDTPGSRKRAWIRLHHWLFPDGTSKLFSTQISLVVSSPHYGGSSTTLHSPKPHGELPLPIMPSRWKPSSEPSDESIIIHPMIITFSGITPADHDLHFRVLYLDQAIVWGSSRNLPLATALASLWCLYK